MCTIVCLIAEVLRKYNQSHMLSSIFGSCKLLKNPLPLGMGRFSRKALGMFDKKWIRDNFTDKDKEGIDIEELKLHIATGEEMERAEDFE